MQGLPDNSFGKKERLCNKKKIDELFSGSKSFIAYPLRVVYKQTTVTDVSELGACILISVSKKKFKRAVKRNRVKRLIREAYRLNKTQLLDALFENESHFDIAFLFLKDELPKYDEIEKAILKAINILVENLKESAS